MHWSTKSQFFFRRLRNRRRLLLLLRVILIRPRRGYTPSNPARRQMCRGLCCVEVLWPLVCVVMWSCARWVANKQQTVITNTQNCTAPNQSMATKTNIIQQGMRRRPPPPHLLYCTRIQSCLATAAGAPCRTNNAERMVRLCS